VRVRIANGLRLLHPLTADWVPEVLTCSSLEGPEFRKSGGGKNFPGFGDFHQNRRASGAFETKARRQARRWMWEGGREPFVGVFDGNPMSGKRLSELEAKVASSRLTPSAAAQILLTGFPAATE